MTATTDKSSASDERLAALVESIVSKKGPCNIEALCGEHPDLADELRQLLAVGQIADICRSFEQKTMVGRPYPTPTIEALPRKLGDYELVAELGRGGMGVVYKARDSKLDRFVALKMILRGSLASDIDVERFRSEATSAAGLAHPNIVPVYNVGEHNGQAYFCMKYVEGNTLAQLIAEGPLAQRRAASYALKIARAVQHAHEHGVLHRDLKPSNILIDDGNEPLVTDFGLAKRVAGGASLTGSGAILGTPSYMAPEQADSNAGKPSSTACDIYSLGAILYEMLTGRPPFLAATPMETLLLVLSEEPVRPRLLNPQIDTDLEFICRKCLEKRPEHRYATAGQLADDLQAFLQGEPVSARSSSLIYLVSRLLRESHHAPVLENWGLLWMWHSLQLFLLCAVTSGMFALGVTSHWPYLALWSVGLVVWGSIFWQLRRRGGPVTFVERQIAHAWAAGVAASIAIFFIEVLLDLPALALSPVLAVVAGMVFLVKAGTLSGWFYGVAAVSFLVAIPMAILGPAYGPLLFGAVSAVGFFVPGLKYYRLARTRQTRC